MRRVHLFELEDLPWVPAAIRDGGTDLLDLGFERVGYYRGVIPKLVALLDRCGATSIVDVCSGGGGGALFARDALRREGRDEIEIVLTDRYPSDTGAKRVAGRADARLSYRSDPVDALSVPDDLQGVRTMWGALHHFTPEQVSALLASVVRSRKPLAFFDVAASPALRKMPVVFAPLAMMFNMVVLILGSMALMPLVRPVRASRLLLTYVLPLVPVLVAWDGTVSAMRAYAADELLALARAVPGADEYEWDAGVAGSALYLTGTRLP